MTAANAPAQYTTEQADVLVAWMRANAVGRAWTVSEIAWPLELKERKARAILSDLDGVEFDVILDGAHGLRIAHDPPTPEERDDLAKTTRNFQSRAFSLHDRVRRRASSEAACASEPAPAQQEMELAV